MARPFKEEVQEWIKGALAMETSASKVPKNGTPRARNTAWLKSAFPAKRKGVSIVTSASESGHHPILNGGHALGMNWVIDDLGRWSKVTAGVLGAIDAAATTPFTAGTHYPAWTVAKDHIFVANSLERKKTNGTVVTEWGFDPPGAPTVTDSGVAGNPSGTYIFGLTAYNETTGHESSLSSTTSVAVVGKKITVSWTYPSDTQISKVRVHIFKTGLSSQFFRLGATDVTPTPDTTTGGYASSTVSITVNVTDADINNLIIKSPDQNENGRPPSGITHCAWANGRMWVTDGTYAYYSKLDDPESFDSRKYEVINTNDDSDIVWMGPISEEQILVFKQSSSHLIVGPSDPNLWSVQPLDPIVGAVNFRAVVFTEGAIWWEANQGIFRLKYSTDAGVLGKPERMDSPSVSDHIEDLNSAQLDATCAAYDSTRQRIFFAIPLVVTDTNNTAILPYLAESQGLWEDVWDPMEISSMFTFLDSTDKPYVAIGGYKGRVFRLWDLPYVDGARVSDGVSVFYTLTGTPTAIGAMSLTDSHATFDTAGDALAEVVVLAVSTSGTTVRNVIVSNTSTVLTLKYNWTITPDLTWTYYIGSPNFEFDTTHFHPTSTPGVEGSDFNSRNFKRVLVRGATDTGQSTLTVYPILDGNFEFPTSVEAPISSGGAQFDIDQFDVAVFGSGSISTIHRSLGVRGRTCGLRIVNREPGAGVILLSLGIYGTEHSYKA